MINNIKHKKVILIITLIIFICITYYVLNVDTAMDTIYKLSNDSDISITRIEVKVFDNFDRYEYLLVNKKGIEEFFNELDKIKIIDNIFSNLLKTKVYSDLDFEKYIISLYKKDRLVGYFDITRRDVYIGGVTNSTYVYKITNYSKIDLKRLYQIAQNYGEVLNEN